MAETHEPGDSSDGFFLLRGPPDLDGEGAELDETRDQSRMQPGVSGDVLDGAVRDSSGTNGENVASGHGDHRPVVRGSKPVAASFS